MSPFSFNTTRSIINKPGALDDVANACGKLGIRRPLVITDGGIVRLGLLERLQSLLSAGGLKPVAFTEVIADPPEQIVQDALEVGKRHDADGVIGLGGGSSMDTAKVVALLAGSGEKVEDAYGVDQARGPRLPLILIPTTAGTGSEVTAVAILTTGETTKQGIVSDHLYPDIAVLDAALTLGLPPRLTAMTGVDAMVHALEAYTSAHKKNAYSDMLAREALRLMSENIVQATHDGDDLAAREAMLLGACLAGQAFANAPVAAVHALAYPLGGHYHIPHGLSNSLVLPEVLRFNATYATEHYAELAAVVLPADELSQSAEERCGQFIDYFVALIKQLELPGTLSEVDVPEPDLPMLARDAMAQQRLLVNNPREVTEADALAIYKAAY
ncbi:MAG: iron-containing alcohol dehydrogenase [Pseudomonadota bacterium]